MKNASGRFVFSLSVGYLYIKCHFFIMFSHVFMYVLIVKILSYVDEIKNIYLPKTNVFIRSADSDISFKSYFLNYVVNISEIIVLS